MSILCRPTICSLYQNTLYIYSLLVLFWKYKVCRSYMHSKIYEKFNGSFYWAWFSGGFRHDAALGMMSSFLLREGMLTFFFGILMFHYQILKWIIIVIKNLTLKYFLILSYIKYIISLIPSLQRIKIFILRTKFCNVMWKIILYIPYFSFRFSSSIMTRCEKIVFPYISTHHTSDLAF